MNAGQSAPMILAIGSRDDFLHVYRDDRELLSDDDIGAGAGEISGPLEFFNTQGYRLTGVYDRRWHLVRLVPTTDPPDLTTVARRVRNVIDRMRLYLTRHPEEAALYGMTSDEALTLFPCLDTSLRLEEFLRAFVGDGERVHPRAAGLGDDDSGSQWHNFWHRSGWNHG